MLFLSIQISRSLTSTISPGVAMPLTEEALRAHDKSKGFSSTTHYLPPSESRFVNDVLGSLLTQIFPPAKKIL